TPLPAGFGDALTSMMTFILVVTAIFGFAIAAVGFVAALRRWTWAYYAILVLFGLGILSLLYSVLSLVASSAASSLYGGFSLPGWTYVVSIATGLIDIGLFTWMLIALTRYGPWAMRKVN
ncbi:MAG TPA: hypothetical protein VJT78_10065, partial [Candidatus Dormibacteraeota bacterium]|nr:hypothetical protein [Candidatus Dormibacteraeota bacterium]